MSNPMKYIKSLEAAGFKRDQAEAQVQIIFDVLEGDLVTKSEFESFRSEMRLFKEQVDRRFVELELRLVIKLGLISVTTTSIAVGILSWLIKAKS